MAVRDEKKYMFTVLFSPGGVLDAILENKTIMNTVTSFFK